jgi:hypothetical protein
VLGIAPIIVANREITFPNFSHYALPASLGLAFALAGGLFSVAQPKLRTSLFSGLVLLSALTHWGLGRRAAKQQTISSLASKIVACPSITAGTTLLPSIRARRLRRHGHCVGPRQLHLLPGAKAQLQWVSISHSRPTHPPSTFCRHDPRKHLRATFENRYARTVVIHPPKMPAWRPDPRVALSVTDNPNAFDAGSRRKHPARGPRAAPPVWPEPQHGWCFYFEKAALAGQQGDWQQVAASQDQVNKLGLHPTDQIEWMPFLQAQAYLGDLQQVKQIASRINTEKLYKQQACQNLGAMSDYGYPLSAETEALVNAFFCGAKP